ncbi:Activating signal cointegrator 1 complex subunit [Sesamum angolense]|uniref:Activating signal cointegrator 1 complex subunit n=1 Tax=Sesamum angolense TaxID=2727404 RepID=A0AAE1W6K1_9LAMI|nr:Activating signal cointegrator 1 complex subunit [Sesamum angolense]
MSNRFASQNRTDCKNSAKTQMKFIPKRDIQNPNSQQTLSNSLRAATNTVGGGGGDAAAASTSRIRMGGNGEWVNKKSPSGNFVIYLPQDEAVAAGLGPEEGGLDPVEAQRVVDLLNRELSRLLKLHPRDFWREVSADESLNAFLESFLKFRSRWYDFPHRRAQGTVAGVIVGEFELCRRVFMVLYRLSSNRDPGAKAADTLSPKDHAAYCKLDWVGSGKMVVMVPSFILFVLTFSKFGYPNLRTPEVELGEAIVDSNRGELGWRTQVKILIVDQSRAPSVVIYESVVSFGLPKNSFALLQEKKLLDLPKLLDICAIYCHENEDLTRILVTNAMKAQPHIQDEFPVLLSHFLSIIQTMYQRCSSSLEAPSAVAYLVLFSSGGHQDQGSSRLHYDYLEVMDFINDSVVSLDSFVNAYKHAAVYFSSPVESSYGNEELLTTLARLHDSLLPSLQRGFNIILGTVEDRNKETSSDLLSNVFTSLKMLSTRIAKLGWKLLYFCSLSDEAFQSSYSLPISMKMFPPNVEDPVVRADILIQTIRDLTGHHTDVPAVRTWGTFIQNIQKNHNMMNRIELLQKTGWLSMDDEQYQFLSGIMMNPPQAGVKEKNSTSFPVAGKKMQTDEDAAIIESKISQIRELFPEYGRGFLVACLEAYNHDAEEVIQRILEGTLHEELQSLDITLETIPPSKSAPSMSRHDKGKGKLVESEITPPEIVAPTTVKTQAGVSSGSSSSSAGRFVRKNTGDLSDFQTLNAKKEKELAKTAALISQLEYEDEYDDSFDDLGLSVGDSGFDEPETLGDKMGSHRGRGVETDGGSSTLNADTQKWNSRKKPQFYVKDGKNYSYKVEGSVAVTSSAEAKLVNQAQKELIHGLGRGGNIPLGAVKRLTESKEDQQNDEPNMNEVGGRGGQGATRGRGRRGFLPSTPRSLPGSNDKQDDEQGTDEGGGRGGRGNTRGRGRRGPRVEVLVHEDRDDVRSSNEFARGEDVAAYLLRGTRFKSHKN